MKSKILNTTAVSTAMVALWEEILAFEVHLNSAKFQGTEADSINCERCGATNLPSMVCPRCNDALFIKLKLGERKDWISTADVLRRLEILKALLREVNSL